MNDINIKVSVPKNDHPPYGYEHYTGQPVAPNSHLSHCCRVFTTLDQVALFCSCGEWMASGSCYSTPARDVQAILIGEWRKHAVDDIGRE